MTRLPEVMGVRASRPRRRARPPSASWAAAHPGAGAPPPWSCRRRGCRCPCRSRAPGASAAWLSAASTLLEAGWRIAGLGAHLGRDRNLEDLEIVRGRDLVVLEPARDVDRLAGLHPDGRAILEFEIDPTLERVDELRLADVPMPAGRL